MENPYLLMLIALGVLAVIDLVVGVSNDAVNFLNSAIGSKAFSVKRILVIASLGVFFGAVSSSGMMEVARKGIFHPEMFVFEEIMYVFMAVMITDILLLDIFNSLGMPTSTTVSIVFELLGAAVAIALLKISANGDSITHLGEYINTSKALQIIGGILLSVVVSFTIGAIVQFISRVLYTFDFKSRPNYVNVLFGGFAFASITFFIVFKGLKGTPYYKDIKVFLQGATTMIMLGSFVFSTIFSFILIKFFKINILYPIIGLGVFSLAIAFSGNDLVNFIGVPMAALNSYDAWMESGMKATEYSMGALGKKVPSNTYLLLLAGGIMVITLWTSKKAKSVIETEVNLSRQNHGAERFESNFLSRIAVKFAITLNKIFCAILPEKTLVYINSRFEKPMEMPSKNNDAPAFDLVRASVNLVVAGILISIATSMKLPLSTTYVSFMVAMGTSLADRAWGRDSAVYRVAGVLSVIAGWFMTAIIAFVASATVAYFISWTQIMIPIFLLLVLSLLVRSSIIHRKKQKEKELEQQNTSAEIKTINEIIDESNKHISKVAKRVDKLYSNVVKGLAKEDVKSLKKNDKLVAKLNKDIDALKEGVFYFIKALDDNSVKASKFYILTLSHLRDIALSVQDISKSSFKHLDNNHKSLKKSQISDLKEINKNFSKTLNKVTDAFENSDSDDKFQDVIKDKKGLLNDVNKFIENQIARVSKTEESSPKNATLYFGILLETQDLINAFLDLVEMYDEFKLLAKNS